MSKRILLVDDNAVFLKSATEKIQREGFQVDSTESGLEAFDLIRSQRYDVAILDLDLPDLSGMDLIKVLKAQSTHTQIVIISAYPDWSHFQTQYSELGTTIPILKKPFDVRVLINQIKSLSGGSV